jgi:copper(I)-binding protein
MLMEGNVMRMRALESLEIAPGETIKMQPGKGLHIMLIGLKQALKAGDKVPVTLVFEKAGKVDVELMVHAIKAGDKAHMHH